jgi:hypothetical protein
MTIPVSILVYLTVSRLAIVAAGLFCLFLGYRLLAKITPTPSASNTEISSSLPGLKITVKNAAPGTAFALFGAAMLLAAVIQDSPSFAVSWLKQAASQTSSPQSAVPFDEGTLQVRGAQPDTIQALTSAGANLEKQGDKMGAQQKFREAVARIADPINDLAWSYHETGREKEALGLATIAVQLVPDQPDYADTLAKIRSSLAASPAPSRQAH